MSKPTIKKSHFINLVEDKPDTYIAEIMFGYDDYPVEPNNGNSLADSIDEDSNHALLFIHNKNFFQNGTINTDWILLYTVYSIDDFCNPILQKNIHRSENTTKIHCNSGFVNFNHKGTIPGYGLVLFNRYGIFNIISMENATKKPPISYDSSAGENLIHQKDSEQLIFNRIPSGLYFHDAGARNILMFGTTKENCEGYTNRKISAATKSREGIAMVWNPSEGDYINMVRSGLIQN